jgi:transcriptional regulator with XRE-family HTH domain
MTRRSRNHSVDHHVGATIRTRRKALGISQTKLAVRVGLTFQQIQKYECGTNRVSASTLYEIAKALSAPVAEFFDGLPVTGKQPSRQTRVLTRFAAAKEGLMIAEAFPRIDDKGQRRAIVALIRTMAERR